MKKTYYVKPSVDVLPIAVEAITLTMSIQGKDSKGETVYDRHEVTEDDSGFSDKDGEGFWAGGKAGGRGSNAWE